ncbi:hypothetical protein BVY04_00255 [bacterium M21]|nr:hypothetical protein BVY04_00255 [bacterium M21]
MYFAIFPTVGAAIGAVTNQIAIKMLFRPYKPWMVGGVKVPFTPGVIPQQRGQIAKNIAETFESNLLSGEEIHALITGDKVKIALEGKVDEFLQTLGPLAAMAMGMKGKIIEKILEGIEEVANDSIQHGGDLHIAQKIEAKINEMDIEKLEDLVLGFSKEQFRYITLFGGILGALIGLVQAGLSVVLAG